MSTSRPSPAFPSPALLQLLRGAAGAKDVCLPVHRDVVRCWCNLESLRHFHPERFRAAAEFIDRLMGDDTEGGE